MQRPRHDLPPEDATSSGPRTTDRGLSLLRAVAEAPHGLTLADAARAVELSPSTALRHLRSLEAAGFVNRRPADGRFEPGAVLLRIAQTLAASFSLATRAQPVLDELTAESGESVYLAEPVDRRLAIYSAMAESRHAIRHVSWLGNRVPRSSTAVGAALAGRTDERGVTVRQDAIEDGVTAMSAPVRAGGRIVAALSIIGPSNRFDADAQRAAAPRLVAAATSLST